MTNTMTNTMNTHTTNTLTMSSREIADLVEVRHDSVKRAIERLADRGVIEFPPSVVIPTATKPTTVYMIGKRDSYVIVAQLCPEFTARLVDRWQELEAQVAQPPAHTLPQTYIEALQALLESEKQKQLAIATKAEIGSRREATAMNTASQATKRANRLEIELDQSEQYATVKRMQMLHHGQKFKWQELKAASAEMELPPIKVFDQNYGTVNSYHRDVWLAVYALGVEGI